MAYQSNRNNWPPARKKKKLPKWRRMLRKYWPPIRFGMIVLALIAIIIFGIVGLVSLARNSGDKPNLDTPTFGTDSTQEPTTETAPSPSQIQVQANELMAQAEFIAAGYDYQKAISMLESFEYFNDFPQFAVVDK